ncbi:MAG: hypothetical protein IJX34_02475 [Clostridia bacterium]|nr:hypothetical protein [Clostridia bacterium]
MDIKSVLAGTAIGAILIGCVFGIYTNVHKKEVEENEVNSNIESQFECKQDEKKTLEIVKSEKKYFEEWDSENYEVIVKNTSGVSMQRVQFTLGEGIYEIYNVEPDDEYKIIAYNSENNINLKIMTIDYEIPSYFPDEVSLNTTTENNVLTGVVKNNSEIELYPNQVMIFLKDQNGDIVQKTIEYSGCFFEGLVIKPSTEFKFEIEIPEGHILLKDKGIMFKYSDLEFRMYETRNFKEM